MGSNYYNTGDRNFVLSEGDKEEIKDNNYGLLQAAINGDHEDAKMCMYKGATISSVMKICSENSEPQDVLDTIKLFFEEI